MLAPAAEQAPVMIDSRPRMVGCENRDLGDGVEGMGAGHGCQRLFLLVRLTQKAGVADLVFQGDRQKIGIIMQLAVFAPRLLPQSSSAS